MLKKHIENKGFSLIELIIVVSILSIILAIAVVNYRIFLMQFSVTQAADEATIALRTTQQKAITLGMKSGIYIYSETEYWVFAEPMSTADLIPHKNLLAATALPGTAPPASSYLPRQAPSDRYVSQKVTLANGVKIVWPEVGCAVYSTAETIANEIEKWKITTVYIYPLIVKGQTVLIFLVGNDILGYRVAIVYVDLEGKFLAIYTYDSPGGPIAYDPKSGYVYASGGLLSPDSTPTPYYHGTNVPMPGNPGGPPEFSN